VTELTGLRYKNILEFLYHQSVMFRMEAYYAWQKVLHDVILVIIQKLVSDDISLGVGST